MRNALLLLTFLVTILLNSCSLRYRAYLRNLTNSIATVDIYILNKEFRKTLPPSIKTANRVVEFNNSHRRFFKDTTDIAWVDSSHFRVFIRPQTTVDFEDIAGYFLNSNPSSDIKVIVSSQELIDTLMNGEMDFRREKFTYKQSGFIPPTPLLYYDIKK